MRFKLILALTPEDRVDDILRASREAGAMGATVIPSARGAGMVPKKTFLGLNLTAEHDIMMFIVEERLSAAILDRINEVGQFDTEPGSGLAIQVAIEDAVGLEGQIAAWSKAVRDQE